MRLSIFDSNSAGIRHAKALAGISGIIIIFFELTSSYLLKRHSETYARVSRQYEEALRSRPARPGEPTSVLMVGNSLLLEGVEVDRLRQLTSSSMRIYPVFLEQTGYYDWLYGLQRLFRHGARPQVVVLGVGVNYFLGDTLRQDYAPLMFFDAQDALGAASNLHLDRTATSNLLLAHWSVFWDTRSVIRTQILTHMIPHVKDLFLLANPRPSIPPGPEVEAITVSRLQKLRDLCNAYGANLIFLVPPTLSSESAVGRMILASEKVRVNISVPIDPAALSATFYQPDGMHLNSKGAALFTSALANDLPKKVPVREMMASRN